MLESFLHYVWQFQYFAKHELTTTDGQPVQVFNQGMLNTDAGPDFSNARVGIGTVEWNGTVEIHIKSSDWLQHKHQHDDAYENVVLHVVWEYDKEILRQDGSALPTLELKSRIDPTLLDRYKDLVNNLDEVPCASSYSTVPSITKLSMIDKAVSIRLEKKAHEIITLHACNNQDWNETCYQVLGKNFGFKVNADPFLQLTKSLPYKIILKNSDRLQPLEALLFGQAGFLDKKDSATYHGVLKKEYEFLSKKYFLADQKLSRSQWKFLRLRPANFPTIRIAQFTALLFRNKNIFSKILDAERYKDLVELMAVQQSPFWQHHYGFDSAEKENIPALGDMSKDSIIINSIVPLLVAYGRLNDEQLWIDRALTILQQVPAEQNTIIKRWQKIDQRSASAFDTQGLIELYNGFCLKKRCLDCNIGAAIIKST